MQPRTHIVLAAALLSFAGAALACPPDARGDSPRAAASAAFVAAHRAALVAWKPRAWSPAALGSVAPSGFWVSRDPVDGAFSMPPATDIASREVIGPDGQPIAPDAPVLIEQLADGTLLAHLDDRWADFAVAKLGSDRKPSWTCVHGGQGAHQFMANPIIVVTPASVKREDR